MSETGLIATVAPTELLLWKLCHQYAQEYPNPQHPIRSELIAAFVPRLVRRLLLQRLASAVMTGASALEVMLKSQGTYVAEAANVLKGYSHDLVLQIVELDSYLHEPGLNEGECGNWLTTWGYSFQEATELIRRARRYQPGRRPAKRQTAVHVLEARRLDKSRSWPSLADEFCDCGEPPHDESCHDALRKSAAQLESVLQKYKEIAVPAEPLAPLAKLFLDRLDWKSS